ncbi:iron-sulfur protein [Dethiosulfatarculus sandiegensis]|uniref:Iron-sulfur protein n=1 Tax=Dethiosulfatarculus sandiegensis TaxID=1429043 RepID=A0A0D2JEX1_9BACT|nr:iron-sulfur protein [Dethiosulfatarculus sandiegensis]
MLKKWLTSCVICPRACKVDRTKGEKGFCKIGDKALVNTAQLHFGEEPAISGSRGSGTVFFSGCTLSCRFCQNHEISQGGWGEPMDAKDLAAVFLELSLKGAHNLNLVTPTPHLAVILEALALARENGCNLPVVYNTSGYERPATIRRLKGLIEIYMPDYKYFHEPAAKRLSNAEAYVENCRRSLVEMIAQAGSLQLDEKGVARKGVLVRHLVLPNGLSQSPEVLADLRKLGGKDIWVSLMSQYRPMYKACETKGLERSLIEEEYEQAVKALEENGIENGYIQGLGSVRARHFPRFHKP